MLVSFVNEAPALKISPLPLQKRRREQHHEVTSQAKIKVSIFVWWNAKLIKHHVNQNQFFVNFNKY
jgi:hypothetical protein